MRELLAVPTIGVIQGYTGVATVDAEHQVIVRRGTTCRRPAFGDGSEAQHPESIIESIEERFHELDPEIDVFEVVVLTADSGFNSEDAVKVLQDRSIDGYVADRQFRKHDPRFANQQEYRAKTTDRKRTSKARKYFTADEFTFNEDGTLICPAGKPMNEVAASPCGDACPTGGTRGKATPAGTSWDTRSTVDRASLESDACEALLRRHGR